MKSGTASVAVGTIATNVLRIVSSMTLTRLLDAESYGVVGIVISVQVALALLTDVALVGFIVRHPEAGERRFLDQIWTIRLLRGLGLTIAMALVAEPIAHLLGKPELAMVLAIWGSVFLLEGLSSLAFATAIREQQLWRLTVLDVGANLATFLIAMALVLFYRSYWAMVGGMIGGELCKLAMTYLLFPNTRRRFDYSRARTQELWRFSRLIAASSMLSLLILQFDKIVLAKLLSLSQFGLYAIAVSIGVAPGSLAGAYVSRVLYPAYAKTAAADDRDLLRQVFYRTGRPFRLAYMFACGGLIGSASLIVAILYDPRYAGVTMFLRLIAVNTVLAVSVWSSKEVLMSIGVTRPTLIGNFWRVAWLVIAAVVGAATGNIILLVAIVGTVDVVGLMSAWYALRAERLLDLRQEALGLLVAVAGGCVGYVIAFGAHLAFPSL
ncbi:oligosaccharide flippase family protein [Sphingomonas sp. ID0503]|uniref:oligosaccharide flippase family protein n=1 Tax=Sphingomonas sp. ID0503 TaxID=3399691 RepID=UPI003AFB133C